MILGQDFLAPWGARLELNTHDDGRGVMHLGDFPVRITSNATDLSSSVRSVRSNLPPGAVDDSTAPPPTVANAAMPSGDTGDTGAPQPIVADSELTGFSPAELQY